MASFTQKSGSLSKLWFIGNSIWLIFALLLLIGCIDLVKQPQKKEVVIPEPQEPVLKPRPTVSNSEKIPPDLACQVDSDCTSVASDCCSCNMGGSAKAISKSHISDYTKQLLSRCQGIFCIAMISDHPSCNATPVCVQGICTLK